MWKKKVVWLSVIAIGNSYAAYDSEDTVKLYADAAYVYDSNVFRFSDQQENNTTREHQKKGDSSIIAGVGGRIDLSISRQNIYAKADFTQTNYFAFDTLNGSAWDLGLGWDWVIGNQLQGKLSVVTSSDLASFDDVRVSVVDKVKTDEVNWDGAWQLLSNWAIVANAEYSQEEHDTRSYQNANHRQFGGGVRYQSDRGFAMTLDHNMSQHNYKENLYYILAESRGYSEENTRLNLNWPVTSKVDFNVFAGYSRWKSDLDGSKSNKPIGGVDLSWKVTSKTRLKAGVGQKFNTFDDNVSGRDIEKTAYLSTDWQATEKSKFIFRYNYRNLEALSTNGEITQDSNYNTFLLSYDFQILRSMIIKSYVQLQNRDEKINQFDYSDEQVGLSLRYNY